MTKVAIIGQGFIGRAWAISFARAGHEVRAVGRGSGRAARRVRLHREALPDLAANDLLNGQTPDEVLADIDRRQTNSPRRSPAPSMSRRTRPRTSR